MPTVVDVFTRPVHAVDAKLVHSVYLQTPNYFKIISIPLPTLSEVERELEAASLDARRHAELVFRREVAAAEGTASHNSTCEAIGYLDYKLDYPEAGDATVNLLLIAEPWQSHGYGSQVVWDLEARLTGKVTRILASIYGRNPRAERFWRSLGYSFAIDAKPVLEWYAKILTPSTAVKGLCA